MQPYNYISRIIPNITAYTQKGEKTEWTRRPKQKDVNEPTTAPIARGVYHSYRGWFHSDDTGSVGLKRQAHEHYTSTKTPTKPH